MRTLVSAAARASAVRPGPSAPRSNASLGADGSTVDSGTDGGCGASASTVKPASAARSCGQDGSRTNGTRSTWPIETRTDRR